MTLDALPAAPVTLRRALLRHHVHHLRVLLDRDLRTAAVTANRADPDLQASHADGSGHEYWVDAQAGFTTPQQTDLIEFLLSIDDDPAVLAAD